MRILIEEQWTDGNENTYFKVLISRSSYSYSESKASEWYYLIRVDANRDTLDYIASLSGYPTEVSEGGGKYFIGFRQQHVGNLTLNTVTVFPTYL